MTDIMKAMRLQEDPEEKKKKFFIVRWKDQFDMWFYNKFRRSWYYKYIVYPFADFKTGIRNIIKWLPIIWKDRDWDHGYLMNVLRFKIDEMQKHIDKYGHMVNYQKFPMIRDMKLCVGLIDKIREDVYEMEYHDYHKSKFDFIPIPGQTNFELDMSTISDNLDEYFAKYPKAVKVAKEQLVRNGRDVEDPDARTIIAIMTGAERHRKAKALLFRILNEKIEHWWD